MLKKCDAIPHLNSICFRTKLVKFLSIKNYRKSAYYNAKKYFDVFFLCKSMLPEFCAFFGSIHKL